MGDCFGNDRVSSCGGVSVIDQDLLARLGGLVENVLGPSDLSFC